MLDGFSRTTADSAHPKTLPDTLLSEGSAAGKLGTLRIALFGAFGAGNFGNDATLQAFHYHLHRLVPSAEFSCICTGPGAVAASYDIAAVPSRLSLAMRWAPRSRLGRVVRRLFVGIPGEPRQWLHSLITVWGIDALVVPGTGILQDADTLLGWGPYDMFRWSLTAKLCRCKLLFVSVGAGPLYSSAGKFFVKTALRLADYRSYRDESTRQCLEGVWSAAGRDPIYPDLVFSLPESLMPGERDQLAGRPVVGLGLKVDAGRYGAGLPTSIRHSVYLQGFVELARWLLAHGYTIRLLIGDINNDTAVVREFLCLLKKRSATQDAGQIIDEPIVSVEDLLEQTAATDFVVATRFHNVLSALLLKKPVIAISFHHKCASLMAQMGLSEYAQDINWMDSGRLVERFLLLQQNSDDVRRIIGNEVEVCRRALDEQYAIVLSEICSCRS